MTLKVWESQGPEEKFIKQAIKDYRKVDRNVKFIYEPVGSVDADGKIMLDGPAGVGADVFVVPHDHMGSLVIGGHILENTMDMSAFVPAAVIGASYGGKVYGYPLAVETYALFYNKDIIPNPPKTWEEVFEFAKTWTDKSKNKYAIAWPVTDAYYDFMFYAGYGAQLFGPNGDDRHQQSIAQDASGHNRKALLSYGLLDHWGHSTGLAGLKLSRRVTTRLKTPGFLESGVKKPLRTNWNLSPGLASASAISSLQPVQMVTLSGFRKSL